MSTILDRTITLLSKFNLDEVRPIINELQHIKLVSMQESGINDIKGNILKAAHVEASKAVKAMEALDECNSLLALVALINKQIVALKE